MPYSLLSSLLTKAPTNNQGVLADKTSRGTTEQALLEGFVLCPLFFGLHQPANESFSEPVHGGHVHRLDVVLKRFDNVGDVLHAHLPPVDTDTPCRQETRKVRRTVCFTPSQLTSE